MTSLIWYRPNQEKLRYFYIQIHTTFVAQLTCFEFRITCSFFHHTILLKFHQYKTDIFVDINFCFWLIFTKFLARLTLKYPVVKQKFQQYITAGILTKPALKIISIANFLPDLPFRKCEMKGNVHEFEIMSLSHNWIRLVRDFLNTHKIVWSNWTQFVFHLSANILKQGGTYWQDRKDEQCWCEIKLHDLGTEIQIHYSFFHRVFFT
jgi:hypothetical protein